MYKYFKVSFIIAVTVLALQFVNFTSTDAQAGDEQYHKQILEALKRMNVRLVRIETNKLRSLNAIQESLLNQVMGLRTSQEQIQATGEMNTAEMLASTNGVKTVILDLENHLNDQVMLAFKKESQEEKKFKDRFLPLLVQIEKRLSDQNKALDNTHALLKADLIPALKNENDKTRQIFVAELTKLRR